MNITDILKYQIQHLLRLFSISTYRVAHQANLKPSHHLYSWLFFSLRVRSSFLKDVKVVITKKNKEDVKVAVSQA